MRKLAVVLGFGLVVFSAAARAQFCPGVTPWVFNDVPSNDPFCSYITYMATSGITTGCQVIDANNRLYCPEATVSRKQMSAFLVRLRDNLFPLTCGAGQVMKFNGAAWACANDETAIGGGGGGGTVTSISTGTGLIGSPNPIVGSGSIMIAPGYQLPQGCQVGQVPKSNGAGGWTCQPDANAGGTVTSVSAGAGLTGGTITQTGTIALAATQLLPTTPCAVDQGLKWNGSAWECVAPAGGSGGVGPITMFLRIEGSGTLLVKGDSTDPDHVDEIVVLAYNSGRSNAGLKVNMQDLSFVMNASRASPTLLEYVASGLHLPKAILTIRTAYATPAPPSTFPHQTITLTDVTVVSGQGGGNGAEPRHVENYSLRFSRIETTYTLRRADGTPGAPTKSCWDVQQNMKC